VDRGTRLGRQAVDRIGREIRAARIDRGLSIDKVAGAVGISNAEWSRVERGLSPSVPMLRMARCAAAVGLDLVAKTYPGTSPIRDAAHAELLDDLRAILHPSLRWAAEVPMPIAGDQRAWDGMILGIDWRVGVEAETSPDDGQALARRLTLKLRDGNVDSVLLVVRDGRGAREFVAAARPSLEGLFTVDARRVLAALRSGQAPRGNAVVLLRRSSRGGLPPGV
jgi:transcriptional regulator with XRE-family HTH domain